MSLILAWGWEVSPALLPWGAGLILRPVGYSAGLILGIMGRGEVEASGRLGRILAMLAILFNAIKLAWIVVGVLGYGVALRG